ncbi:MAG: hypothetical protein GY790_12805 [Bacteroidetes bacterium]|nr:hypothetical protein [Bacteroidota bacterium]
MGFESWKKGLFHSRGWISDQVSVNRALGNADQYSVRLVYHETPYLVKLPFRFEEEYLFWDTELNVSFGPTKLKQ